MPGYGSPTVPSLIRPGKFAVATAVFSVMPYNSKTGTPMPMKNSRTSGAIGAAPDPAYRQRRRPILVFRARRAIGNAMAYRMRLPIVWLPPWATLARPIARACRRLKPSMVRLNHVASWPRMRTPAWSFSQIRGTAKNSVGWTSLRLVVIVSIDSAKLSTAPQRTRCHVEKIRSATWHSGR